jgi:hypothetical protein
MPIIYNRGRFMYKKGGHQKKGAKFGTFLKILYIKNNPIIYNRDPIIYNQNYIYRA